MEAAGATEPADITCARSCQIDLEKLRQEFAKKAKRKATAIEDIRQIVERRLAEMLARNPQRMDYYRKYSEIDHFAGLSIPVESLGQRDFMMWDPSACPLCATAMPLEDPR